MPKNSKTNTSSNNDLSIAGSGDNIQSHGSSGGSDAGTVPPTKTKEAYMADGVDAAQAAMLAASAVSAAQASATQAALSVIGQMAATAAAALKLSNDLNDATASFMKNIGSSVKAAAQ